VQTIRGESGDAGAFSTRWANLLRQSGEDVTIVIPHVGWEPAAVDPHWRARYQANGISLIELPCPKAVDSRWPDVPTMRVAEVVAPLLGGFDIVYSQDAANPLFQLLRERRYTTKRGPICVTVLLGPSEWQLKSNEQYPELPRDLHIAYIERYSARHSDFVVSPSRYMVEHLKHLGWEFAAEPEVLGLPMPEPIASSAKPANRPISTIVYLGRVEERKGIRNFALALRHLAKLVPDRPAVVLLGAVPDPRLLDFALLHLKDAGFAVSQETSLDREATIKYLEGRAAETLCVVASRADSYPYSLIEASLVPGLNLVACAGGGVAEMFEGAELQLCDPHPMDLASKIAERLGRPLAESELARYDCRAANERWLDVHRRALAPADTKHPRALPPDRPSVDVCVTYFQKAPYLDHLVTALEHQTETDFHVIAVNDGSPDDESNRVFEKYAEKVQPRSWDFFRQENAFVDAARNNAVRRGKGELILFVDADDVPARNAVARMREAITLSGDDALICSSYLFATEKAPFDPETGETTVPAYATSVPLGIDLVGGLLNPSAFGGSMFMVRRSVFEAIGGFRELRGAGHEDWEIYVRIALAGYKIDILPEFLHFYRQVEGSLARVLPQESSRRRLLDAYESRLTAAGLQGGALALAGLYQSAKDMEKRIKILSAQVDAPKGSYAFFSRSSKRFESDGISVDRIRAWYRHALSLETRLSIHRIFLAPFVGPYRPPPA
jgi:GT2 family glycosyltransferase/glycosyltransferase involved in cell wall biosynthesis